MEKTNSVPNRLLILGNGFDLSLGHVKQDILILQKVAFGRRI